MKDLIVLVVINVLVKFHGICDGMGNTQNLEQIHLVGGCRYVIALVRQQLFIITQLQTHA